jgi:hypothetical protein
MRRVLTILIFLEVIWGCGRINYVIINKSDKPVTIFMVSQDTVFLEFENSMLLKNILKKNISDYTYKVNKSGNELDYQFSLNPQKRINYKSGYTSYDYRKLRVFLLGYKFLNVVDTIYYSNDEKIKINRLRDKSFYSVNKLYYYVIVEK